MTTGRTKTTAMTDLLETIAELTNDVLTHEFGDEFDWDFFVGANWAVSRPTPPNISPKEPYLFKTLFDIRHEANDVLNYLVDATEEDCKELLEIEP